MISDCICMKSLYKVQWQLIINKLNNERFVCKYS